MNRLVIATGNAGKRREFEAMLHDLVEPDWQILDRKSWPEPLPEPVEDRGTFEGNAVVKAVEIARQTGCCALSDDSGLVVDALGGAPGVDSALYAGVGASDAENNARLVRELAGVPPDKRSARFVAVVCIALVDDPVGRSLLARRGLQFGDIPTGDPEAGEGRLVRTGGDDAREVAVVWFRGHIEGRILEEARGDGGFGYDPYFFVPERGQTLAEMPLAAKNAISHRARALGKMAGFWG